MFFFCFLFFSAHFTGKHVTPGQHAVCREGTYFAVLCFFLDCYQRM